MRKGYLVGFFTLFLCLRAIAQSVNIKGAEPRDKKISDSQVLKVYFEANPEGTYTVTVSSTYVTERIVDDYKDRPYSTGLSYAFTVKPLRDLVDESGNTVDDTYTLKVQIKSGNEVASATLSFILDNPPEPPENFSASPGDGYVHLSWSRHRDNDIKEFRIYYDTTPSPYPQSPTSSDYLNVKVLEGREQTGADITGLTNGVTYYFSIVAVDIYNNASTFSAEISATPRYESGFSDFSNEKVGCIIAKNFGRYSALTKRLREFRTFLTSVFPHAVKLYYAWSVSSLMEEENGRLASRLLQGVFSLLLSIIHISFYPEVMFLIGLYTSFFFIFRKKRKILLIIFAGVVLFFSSTSLAGSPMNFYLDLKAGNMKFDRTSGKENWAQIYGSGGHASIWGKLGYEVPWKKFGTWILSGTGGIFWDKGYGLIQEPSGETSRGGKDLTFYIFPLGAELTYLARYIEVQYIVPFATAGVVGYFFTENKRNGSTVKKGTVGGYYFSAGALIQLDWMEAEYANKLDVDWGVNHTYILLEYRWSHVDSFGKYSYFDFSNNTFFAGIAFEF